MLDPGLSARLDALAAEFRELEARLADPVTLADPDTLRMVSQRHRELEPMAQAFASYTARLGDLDAARELLAGADRRGPRPSHRPRIDQAAAELDRLRAELRELLLPRDPNAGRAVIIEIRGAEGGEEANLFARDLFDMYIAYATRRTVEGRDAVARRRATSAASTR